MSDPRTIEIFGSTFTIVANTEETGGAFGLIDCGMAPGFAGAPLHIHEREDEACYVLEGHLLVECGERERLVGPGECVFLPRGIAHTFRNPGSAPVRYLGMVIPGGFEHYFRDLAAVLEAGAAFTPAAIGPLMTRYGLRVAGATEAASKDAN